MMIRIALLFSILLSLAVAQDEQRPRVNRAEHGFKGPYGDSVRESGIPFWLHSPGVAVNTSFVRLTPAKQSKVGFLWNEQKSTLIDWEMQVQMNIHNEGKGMGGDGMAFWYTEKASLWGPVYGSADHWKGLGIMIDTFNNDGRGYNPAVTIHINNGMKKYPSAEDGERGEAGKCTYQIREKKIAMKVEYIQRQLSVYFANMDGDGNVGDWFPCAENMPAILGSNKYFGVSSSTGDLADNHDILSMQVWDRTMPDSDLESVVKEYARFIRAEIAESQIPDSEFQSHVTSTVNQMQGNINYLQESTVWLDVMQGHIRAALLRLGIKVDPDDEGETAKTTASATAEELANIKLEAQVLHELLQEAQLKISKRSSDQLPIASMQQQELTDDKKLAGQSIQSLLAEMESLLQNHHAVVSQRQTELRQEITALAARSTSGMETYALLFAISVISVQIYFNLQTDKSPALPFRSPRTSF